MLEHADRHSAVTQRSCEVEFRGSSAPNWRTCADPRTFFIPLTRRGRHGRIQKLMSYRRVCFRNSGPGSSFRSPAACISSVRRVHDAARLIASPLRLQELHDDSAAASAHVGVCPCVHSKNACAWSVSGEVLRERLWPTGTAATDPCRSG